MRRENLPLRAISDFMRRSKRASLDHLLGSYEERIGH
jgi:hypothetical protein